MTSLTPDKVDYLCKEILYYEYLLGASLIFVKRSCHGLVTLSCKTAFNINLIDALS